jgi:uncharacterized paraquat-inducible protein A
MTGYHRRTFIVRALQASALIFVRTSAGATCVDQDELSDSVQSMRESLEYTDSAPDAKQSCRHCSFFKAAKPSDACAGCEVLGSSVSATGHCVSWTKRG